MIVFLTFYIFVILFCTLLHEIGHGIGGILTPGAHVHIYLGKRSKENKENKENKEIFRLGRFHFHIHWSYIGFTLWEGNFTRRQRALALAGG